VALGGVALLMALLGLAAGAGAAAATGDGGLVGPVVVAALVRVPAAWVVTGIAVALYGLAPRFVALTWVALLGFLIIGDFGSLWGLPDWVAKISPFAHSPNLPGGDLNPGSLVALTLVACLLLAVGVLGWRRRDLLTA
jgi:ABC-2 type transport system permease protein